MTKQPTSLKRLFSPKHIAFIGGNDAVLAIERCVEFGFTGEIWPVHPKREEMAGYKCYKSLADLPEVPDAAFVAVNRDLAIDVVGQLSDMGAGGCVCYAAGFAEMGGDGVPAQAALIDASGDMPLVGPNCLGFVNFMDKVALWPYIYAGDKVDSGVALVSQSGNVAMNLTMNERSVPFTHLISAGNQAVLGVPEYIDALLEDDRVKAIALYIEGISNVNTFAESALRALEKGVPIIALKVGVSDLGAKQASSHTSSLVGSDALIDTLFERVGVIRVPSLSALLETAKMLTVSGPMVGRKISSLSCSGGEAALMADLAEKYDLEFPEFEKEHYAELSDLLSKYATISNPLDYNTAIWGDKQLMKDCFATVLKNQFDLHCLIFDYPTIPFNKEVAGWADCLTAFIEAAKETGAPAAVITTISELIPEVDRTRMIEAGVVPLQGSEDALIAISLACWYSDRRKEILAGYKLPKRAPVSKADDVEFNMLDEATSKQMLAAYGLPVPPSKIVTASEAADAAAGLGFPVVVKASGDNMAHKTELGAVALNLKSADDVNAAVQKIGDNVAHVSGFEGKFLVEKMVSGTTAELIVGVKRDEQFGPVLVVGAGGILVELMEDAATMLLPVDRDDVVAAIKSLKSFKLLDGFRGSEKADMDAVVDSVMAVANFTIDNWDSVEELDVNPLMVGPKGVGAIAADALIKVSA